MIKQADCDAAPGRIHGLNEAHAALSAGRPALLWTRSIADTETPVSAALKLMEPDRGDWLLESVEGGVARGRYSLIGLDPDLVFRASGCSVEIDRHWKQRTSSAGQFSSIGDDPLGALRALVAECKIDPIPEGLPPTLACLVGYFSYESYALVEKLPRPAENAIAAPDMLFVRPSVIVVFDRLADALWVVAPVWPNTSMDAASQVDTAAEAIETTLARISGPLPKQAPVTAMLPDVGNIRLRPTLADGAYREMVLTAKDHIVAGDIFQVVLAQRFTAEFCLPPFALYRALRRINPSPFLYFLDLPSMAIVGSSPEILVRVRDGEITIRPIAGTRPRGATAIEDAQNRDSLLADPKELAEHLMLLDLGRNDVGRAAAPGSVKVTDSFTIEFYSHVMHIVSNVVGQLSDKQDALDALFAGFPAGTVSGAPKVRAAEIIAALEPETRGAYAGGIGYFAPDGNMDSCIVLRTGIVKDGTLHVTAGAGIVADSDPDYEQRECEAKASALIAAAREATRIAQDTGYGQ